MKQNRPQPFGSYIVITFLCIPTIAWLHTNSEYDDKGQLICGISIMTWLLVNFYTLLVDQVGWVIYVHLFFVPEPTVKGAVSFT